MFDRPTTTARLPPISTPVDSIIRTQPAGVQGAKQGPPVSRLPALTGVNPSTSFSGGIAAITAAGSIWAGSGSCTRIPCTAGSAASAATLPSSSACDVSSGRRITSLLMPHSAQSLALPRTYTWLAGFSPTSTTARQGCTPRSCKAQTLAAASALTAAASVFPLMMAALIRHPPSSGPGRRQGRSGVRSSRWSR